MAEKISNNEVKSINGGYFFETPIDNKRLKALGLECIPHKFHPDEYYLENGRGEKFVFTKRDILGHVPHLSSGPKYTSEEVQEITKWRENNKLKYIVLE